MIARYLKKKNDILKGASTNNLNRVHFGYHYPRDNETAKQSLQGYKSFKKFYSKSIITDFNNYYFIAKNSKVNFKKYLNFCNLNNLKFKILNLKKLPFITKNILGGIKVNEPVYDWSIIKSEISKKLKKLNKNKIYLNEKVLKISKNKNFTVKTNKELYKFDKIIDSILQIYYLLENVDPKNIKILNNLGVLYLYRKYKELKIKFTFSIFFINLFTLNNIFCLFLRKLLFILLKRVNLLKIFLIRNLITFNIKHSIKKR